MRFVLLISVLAMVLDSPALAQGQAKIPSADEVKALLAKGPINEGSWATWKPRLTDWLGDTGKASDPAYKDAERFLLGLADSNASLPGRFNDDHLASYLLGYAYLFRQPPRDENIRLAEKAFRRSIEIAPGFARGYRSLALALVSQVKPIGNNPLGNVGDPRLTEAENALSQAARLDPDLPLAGFQGLIAQRRGQFATAQGLYEKAMQREPHVSGWASYIAECILFDKNVQNPAARIKPLVARFPEDGTLASFYALSLAAENRMSEAADELARARTLGTDPAVLLSAKLVNDIEQAAKPGLLEQFLTIMMWFAITYAGIMLAMAGAGLVLAMKTRGTGALDLLQKQAPEQMLQDGNIARATGETILARLYGFALMIGLILFYAAIPFVIAGLLGLTGLLLYGIFAMGRIPIKLVIVVFIVGGLSAWAVFKSLFTKPPTGGFGLLRTSEQCPQLHQLLAEVARKVDTDPVNDVFLAPGAGIGVHQEGRGPFGMFGVSKRVLTLGFCTLRFLSVGELKAILAHEYAHFSHSDTFYSRFIYQVHMSIEEALYGMKSAGGVISYVNPFYWFLWLYYKSYSLLAAGYSRSREFLADRMAATLYGSAQFKSALEKVCTDGTLFEMTMYNSVSTLLAQQQAYTNMYDAFTQFRNEQISHEERTKLYQDLLGEKGSLFASHPTFAERAEAIATLPAVVDPDNRSALELFDKPAEIEQELTKFMTDYMAYLAYLNAQAQQQQA
jgi:Zn-dependent protease with chaperone function/tetratricopeptide (TPR) repeat protein